MSNVFDQEADVEVSDFWIREHGYMVPCECAEAGVVLVQRSDIRTRWVGSRIRVTEVALHCYAGTCRVCGKLYRTPIKRYEADPLGRLQLVDDDNGSESEDDDDAATSEASGVAGGVASAS